MKSFRLAKPTIKYHRKNVFSSFIRFCSWGYLVIGGLSLLAFITKLTHKNEQYFNIKAFGFSYNGIDPLHPTLILIITLLTYASIVAFGILWGKDWAIKQGKIYAIIATVVTLFGIFCDLQSSPTHISLEPFFLVYFFFALNKKQDEWLNFDPDEVNPFRKLAKTLQE